MMDEKKREKLTRRHAAEFGLKLKKLPGAGYRVVDAATGKEVARIADLDEILDVVFD